MTSTTQTRMAQADAAREATDQLNEHQRNFLLLELTKWADTREGRSFRAYLASANCPSAVTAEDVLALIDDSVAENLREDLGIEKE